MAEITLIKSQLINELWLPSVTKGGSIFYPRLRINKKMKLLTLTSYPNFEEVTEFMRSKLTKKEFIVGWNNERANAWRLDSEGKMANVFAGSKYEDSIILYSHEIQKEFPFHILNLDFSSQNPESENGRLEKEIYSIEHTVKLQVNKGNNGMVLIYTTLLNSNPLNIEEIKRNSDRVITQGWTGLSIEGLPSNTTDNQEKIKCLKGILKQIYSKYQYENIEDLNTSTKALSDGSKYIFSIVALLRRS